ncbi:MAG TPA: rod shape-determining protein MreC [Candidatus Hydrogenedentes bacterium]|nr:rod shape-determining protein MreC [Candidatus Hydrogenedentota bacterium]
MKRRIREHRPIIILAVLVVLCLSSLAVGKRGSLVTRVVRNAISVASHPFWLALDFVEESYDYTAAFVLDYHRHYREAQRLQAEFAEATQRLSEFKELKAERERLRTMLDFERSETVATLLPAKIISRTLGAFTIDRGRMHDVAPAMCVLAPDGAVVGVVSEVSPFNATVLTLHNPDCKIGALIERNRVRGIVRGTGQVAEALCEMEYIDMKDQIGNGDRVLTMGSGMYPAGRPIGTVIGVEAGKTLQKKARVLPDANLQSLDEVFVITQALIPADEMRGQPRPQGAVSRAYPMPDERPPQERYAP